MVIKLFNFVKKFFAASVEESCETEFIIGINKINLARGKITAITFIVLECIQTLVTCITKRNAILEKPYIYYLVMYILLIVLMTAYLLVFINFNKNIPAHMRGIRIVGVLFTGSILLWCAGISLLDQFSSGQVLVYTVAVICVAIAPVLKPLTLSLIYLTVHVFFLVCMPYFQKSDGLIYSNYINSTSFLIISSAVSYMRFKKYIEDFKNKKIIQEKNQELMRVNRQLEEVNCKLEKLSQTDSLTGIFNRMVFDRAIKAEWDRCSRHFMPLSLIMVDIDFFKAYNDNYGHQKGDECIRQIARILSDCARRSSDMAARYGGEEFAVILPYLEKDNAQLLAEKIRNMVEEMAIPHEHSSVSNYVTVSIGVNTVVPSEVASLEEFIRTVDIALYRAKEYRNNIVVA